MRPIGDQQKILHNSRLSYPLCDRCLSWFYLKIIHLKNAAQFVCTFLSHALHSVLTVENKHFSLLAVLLIAYSRRTQAVFIVFPPPSSLPLPTPSYFSKYFITQVTCGLSDNVGADNRVLCSRRYILFTRACL